MPGIKLRAEAPNNKYDKLLFPVLTEPVVQLFDLRQVT